MIALPRCRIKIRLRFFRSVYRIDAAYSALKYRACADNNFVKQGVGEDEVAAFVARRYRGFEKVSHDISDGILTVSYTALDI